MNWKKKRGMRICTIWPDWFHLSPNIVAKTKGAARYRTSDMKAEITISLGNRSITIARTPPGV
jgi:hypothetical protein